MKSLATGDNDVPGGTPVLPAPGQTGPAGAIGPPLPTVIIPLRPVVLIFECILGCNLMFVHYAGGVIATQELLARVVAFHQQLFAVSSTISPAYCGVVVPFGSALTVLFALSMGTSVGVVPALFGTIAI